MLYENAGCLFKAEEKKLGHYLDRVNCDKEQKSCRLCPCQRVLLLFRVMRFSSRLQVFNIQGNPVRRSQGRKHALTFGERSPLNVERVGAVRLIRRKQRASASNVTNRKR